MGGVLRKNVGENVLTLLVQHGHQGNDCWIGIKISDYERTSVVLSYFIHI